MEKMKVKAKSKNFTRVSDILTQMMVEHQGKSETEDPVRLGWSRRYGKMTNTEFETWLNK